MCVLSLPTDAHPIGLLHSQNGRFSFISYFLFTQYFMAACLPIGSCSYSFIT